MTVRVLVDVEGDRAESQELEKKDRAVEYERSGSIEKEFYLKKHASIDEIMHRHSVFGYDPLDKAIQQLVKENGEAANGHSHEYSVEEYRHKFEDLLKDHLETMFEMGLAYDFEFGPGSLGFSILIARYGTEGRMFVEVEETHTNCKAYPEVLKPTDELIAINDELIIDPTEANFADIKKQIVSAPRPVKLTFIQGENRDAAFEAQEARRKQQEAEDLKAAADFLASGPTTEELIEEDAVLESAPLIHEDEQAAVLTVAQVDENEDFVDEAPPPPPVQVAEEAEHLTKAEPPVDLEAEHISQAVAVLDKEDSSKIRTVDIEDDDQIDHSFNFTSAYFCCSCRC